MFSCIVFNVQMKMICFNTWFIKNTPNSKRPENFESKKDPLSYNETWPRSEFSSLMFTFNQTPFLFSGIQESKSALCQRTD